MKINIEQVSTYKNYYKTQNDMAGDKSRDIYPCFHNGPLWVCRNKYKKSLFLIERSKYFVVSRYDKFIWRKELSRVVSDHLGSEKKEKSIMLTPKYICIVLHREYNEGGKS